MTALAKMLVVRDTAAGFTGANPVLRVGEMGIETDTGKLKVGDGVTDWATLDYVGGGGGSGVASITPGAGITVDNTIPTAPVVALSSSALARTIGMTFDARPGAVAAGTVGRAKAPFAGTITGWDIYSNDNTALGTAVFAIRKNGSSIVAAAPPTITADDETSSTTLTGWTTSVALNDFFEFEPVSVSGFVNVSIALRVTPP